MLPVLLLLALSDPQATPQPRDPFFTSTLSAREIENKQAVLETSMGTIVLDLLAAAAPNHVGLYDKGILSMARLDDPASASTSFFIVTARTPALDGKYTVFGRVVEGIEVVERIEAAPVSGETPVTRIDVTRVTLARK